MSRFTRAAALALLLAQLAGCGGSCRDDEAAPDDDGAPPTTQPVDCRRHPEQCR